VGGYDNWHLVGESGPAWVGALLLVGLLLLGVCASVLLLGRPGHVRQGPAAEIPQPRGETGESEEVGRPAGDSATSVSH
jgi:hypothetical protein